MSPAIHSLFEKSKAQEIPKGKILILEGHLVNKIYYVVEGYIKVYTIAGASTQRIPYLYSPGDVFPLTTFLSGGGIARFFYETITPVKVLVLTNKQLESKMIDNLEIAEDLIRITGNTDEQFIRRVNDLVSDEPPLKKVRNLFGFLTEKEGVSKPVVKIGFPLTSRAVANMCGISKDEAARQMQRLKEQKIINVAGNSTVIDRVKLHSLRVP